MKLRGRSSIHRTALLGQSAVSCSICASLPCALHAVARLTATVIDIQATRELSKSAVNRSHKIHDGSLSRNGSQLDLSAVLGTSSKSARTFAQRSCRHHNRLDVSSDRRDSPFPIICES